MVRPSRFNDDKIDVGYNNRSKWGIVDGREESKAVSIDVPAQGRFHGGSHVKKCLPISEPHGVRP